MATESSFKNIPFPEDSELIKHYQPKFLEKGGSHLVYEIPEHQNIVVKASIYDIKDILLGEKSKDEVEKEVSMYNNKIGELRNSFGKEHMVQERCYLMQIPISKDLLDEIFKTDWLKRKPPEGYESLNEVWTSVIIQEKVPEIIDPNHTSLNFGSYLEDGEELDNEEYSKLNDIFIIDGSDIKPDDLERFFNMQDDPRKGHLRDIVEQAKKGERLKQTLKDFVIHAIDFAKETGNILALAGNDNVIFYKKDDNTWNYLLIDAIPVHSEAILTLSKEILHKIARSEQINSKEKDLLMKALNFVRTINGLAKSMGLDEYFDIIGRDVDLKKIPFLDIIKN